MNPYEVLGIQKDLSDADIKQSYRRLAMKHHPDKGGDPEEFKKIAEAYEILSNAERRQQYDDFGSVTMDTGFNPMDTGFNPMDIFNKFETMFQNDIFGPNRIGAPPFGGFAFPNQSNQSNQSDPVTNLFMNMGVMDMSSMNNGCFTQTIIIKDGKKITTNTSNGKTTVIEETIRPTNRLS